MAAPVFVSADATQQVLKWPDMIESLRAAYSVELSPANNPPRAVARGDGNWLRALASIPPAGRFMGTKVFGLSRQLSVNYLITLFDQDTGEIAGLVDGYHVTALRTGATSAVAIDRMAPAGSASVGVLGSGTEARSHLQATAAVREISAVKVFSPTPANRERFAGDFTDQLGAPCTTVASAQEAVEGSDIVIAAARSSDEAPILLGDWLVPETLVVSIGSTLPEQHEIDTRVIEVCDLIVCDMIEEVVHETGDFLDAQKADVAFDDKLASLNELVRGSLDDRLAAARQPMFKSIGSAIQDIAVAELAFNRAIEQGLGVELPIEFLTKRA